MIGMNEWMNGLGFISEISLEIHLIWKITNL